MLPGKSRNFRNFFFRNSIIFYNSHLFLPATHILRVLIDVPHLLIFWIFLYSLPLLFPTRPPCLLFFQNSCLGLVFNIVRSDRPNFSYNRLHNISRLFDVLLNFLSPQVKRWAVITYKHVASQVAEQLKT